MHLLDTSRHSVLFAVFNFLYFFTCDFVLYQTARLFHLGSISPSTVLLRCGGPPGSGKSTLTDSLCTEDWIPWLLRFEHQRDRGSGIPDQRTKGIRCSTWEGEEGQGCVVMDLGGQAEFYSSHQVLLSANDVPIVNAVVVSALAPKEDLEKDVHKWASFFACKVRPNTQRPPLLLIATRGDKANVRQKANVASAHEKLKDMFGDYFRFQDGPFMVNARRSWHSSMKTLRQRFLLLREEVLMVRIVEQENKREDLLAIPLS